MLQFIVAARIYTLESHLGNSLVIFDDLMTLMATFAFVLVMNKKSIDRGWAKK
jgi:hypothetical protein